MDGSKLFYSYLGDISSKSAIINNTKEKGTNSLRNMQLLFRIFHKYNLVSFIIEFNKKFHIHTNAVRLSDLTGKLRSSID